MTKPNSTTRRGFLALGGRVGYRRGRLRDLGLRGVREGTARPAGLRRRVVPIPLSYLWTKLHIHDTPIGLIVIYWAVFSPFATLLLRSFMVAIPRDFEEGAPGSTALGNGRWCSGSCCRCRGPGFLTIALTTALSAYNEFLLAPMLFVFLALQRRFVEGITESGLGGI